MKYILPLIALLALTACEVGEPSCPAERAQKAGEAFAACVAQPHWGGRTCGEAAHTAYCEKIR